MPTGQVGPQGSGGTPVSVLSTTVTLNNSEIIHLPTTPIVIVPAQGAGTMVVPIGLSAFFDWTADYGSINADSWIQLGVPTAPALYLAVNEDGTSSGVNGLLAQGGDTYAFASVPLGQYGLSGWGVIPNAPLAFADLINADLSLSANNGVTGIFTGGNAANTLKVTVLYTIIDV